MELWQAAFLFLIFGLGILALSLYARQNGKRKWMIAAIAVATVILLALVVYLLSAFIFLSAISNEVPDEAAEYLQASPNETLETTPVAAQIESFTQKPEKEEVNISGNNLSISETSEYSPDVLGLRSVQYEEMPIFGTQNEVTKYVLHNFLNNCFEFDFYIKKDIAVDEGTGYFILNRACETALSYYFFSAYNVFDMFTRDCEYEDRVYAKITLHFTEPEFDLKAKEKALEFISENPVPDGGFTDFESEKIYAQKIHDFIGRKVTYSSIGYNPEEMFGMEKYEALQEAYNVLGEGENEAVCAGYARAFALIAQYAGINAAWVFGNETETESHAWNVIYPCDGSEPVLVDITWNDTESDDFDGQEYVSDRYFYLPLTEDTEHFAADYFEEFIN